MIEGWLCDLGCTPKTVSEQGMHWHFEIDYPPNTPHKLHILNPKERSRSLVILSQISISPDHIAAFQELEEGQKYDFLSDLTATLNREFTEFAIQGIEQGLACPTGFQVMSTRYEDALSLDSLARSISSVFKTELAAIACVRRHLTPHGPGGPGHFEFKRTGSLQ